MNRGVQNLLILRVLLCLLCFLLHSCNGEEFSDKVPKRCAEIFNLDKLTKFSSSGRKLNSKKLKGKFYVLKLDLEDSNELKSYLIKKGFSLWEEGGIHYGEINEGWENDEDLIYSTRVKKSGGSEIMAISRKKGILYAISNPK